MQYWSQDANRVDVDTTNFTCTSASNKVDIDSASIEIKLKYLSEMYLRADKSSTCKCCMPKSDFSIRSSAKRLKLECSQAVCCSQCGYSTYVPNDLVEHYLIRHPQPVRAFDCSRCGFTSFSSVEIMKHFSNVHKSEQ